MKKSNHYQKIEYSDLKPKFKNTFRCIDNIEIVKKNCFLFTILNNYERVFNLISFF